MMQQVECTLWDSVEVDETLPHTLNTMIRSAYFAAGGGAALRYRVSVTDVIAHLLRTGVTHVSRPERAATNIACVVQATAMARGDAQAWADVMNLLAPNFDRACAQRLEPVRGIAFARRFWLDLRRRTGSASRNHGTRVPDVREYWGERPMRYWLADRLLGTLETELRRRPPSHNPRLDSGNGARTLRMPGMVITAEAKAT